MSTRRSSGCRVLGGSTLVLACLLSTPVAILAQSEMVPSDAIDLFEPPANAVVCRSVVPTQADSADILLQMMYGAASITDRQAIAAYSAGGEPLYVGVSIVDRSTPTHRLYQALVKFGAAEPHGVFRVLVRPGGDATRDPSRNPGRDNPLTDEQVVRAKSLAGWFWERRCLPGVELGNGGAP